MAQQLPNGNQQFVDQNGKPLVGGQVFFYGPGTETPKDTYQDDGQTILNTNPVILDARGQAVIWGSGVYRQVLKDSLGNQIWDRVVSTPASDADVSGLTSYINQQISTLSNSLSSSSGSSLVGFLQDGTGAVSRTIQDKDRDIVSVKDFGAKGDGTTDDTAAVQAAVNFCILNGRTLYVPATANGYKLTSTISISGPVHIQGDGVEPCSKLGAQVNVRGPGSWFYINHTGIGFAYNVGNGASVSVVRASIDRIGTYRDQPTPSTGSYNPNNNDFDFYLYNCDSSFTNFCTLNPTKGVRINATPADSASRAYFCNWLADPLVTGLQIDFCADVVRLQDVHFWPFSLSGSTAVTYKRANCTGLSLFRCDNPVVEKFFAWGLKWPVYIGSNSSGTVSKAQLSSCDFDSFGADGLIFDAVGASAILTNCVMQGVDGGTANNCIEFTTTSGGCDLSLIGFDGGLTSQDVVRIVGTSNNVVRIGGSFRGYNWNASGVGYPGIEIGTNNQLFLDCEPYLVAPTNPAPLLGAGGTVTFMAGVPNTNATTDGSGNISIPNKYGRAARGCAVSILNGGAGFFVQPSAFSSSNVTVNVRSQNGAILASTAVVISAILIF